MSDFTTKHAENIDSITIGTESYEGSLDYSIQKPVNPVPFEGDAADNPQDTYLDGGMYQVTVTGQKLTPLGSSGIMALRNTDLSALVIVVNTRPSGTKTLSLVSGAKCKIGPYRKRAVHGQPSTEEFTIACWHPSGIKPIQEVIA